MKDHQNLPAIIDFIFEETTCRTLYDTKTRMGYVCLADLLKAMGSSSGPRHVLPEIEEMFGKGGKIITPLSTPGGNQDVIFISEHAALFVISRGRTEVSKRLNRWLFGEVLPALRKTGTYTLSGSNRPFDPAIAKQYNLGVKIILNALKLNKSMGMEIYDARVAAIYSGTQVSGMDFSHLIDKIPKPGEPTEPRPVRKPTSRKEELDHREGNLADHFFSGLASLTPAQRVPFMEVRNKRVMIRLNQAAAALTGNGVSLRLMPSLHQSLYEHPAFVNSRVGYRGRFGAAVSRVIKVWEFKASVLCELGFSDLAGGNGGESC